MKLALGPITYYWDQETIRSYYKNFMDGCVDIVYLGETVCSKRRSMTPDDWIELGRELSKQGVQVVLSTLSLIEADSELGQVRNICEQQEFPVEANDLSSVHYRQGLGRPYVTGPSVNIYNGKTLDYLNQHDLQRWVLPVELGKQTLKDIVEQASEPCEIEVFAYGHLPLAYSARCFTARAENLPKDDCQFVCQRYPDGLPVFSQERQLLFNINGIQTQSGNKINLIEQVQEMRELGVQVLRLSPDSDAEVMRSVIDDYRRALAGESIKLIDPHKYCNGYWFGEAGMSHLQDIAE